MLDVLRNAGVEVLDDGLRLVLSKDLVREELQANAQRFGSVLIDW